MKEPVNRLREARKTAGFTQAELAELAGTTGATINKLETGTRKLTMEWAQRLAPHLSVPPLALFPATVSPYGGIDGDPNFVAVQSQKIRGEIAAGVWMLKESAPIGTEQEFSTIAGRWQGCTQLGYRHRGHAMGGARIFDGDCVVIVNYAEAKRGLANGDLVVIERERGDLVERSCKQLAIRQGGGFAFHNMPQIADAAFADVVECDDAMKEADGTTVAVLGFVVSVTRFVI